MQKITKLIILGTPAKNRVIIPIRRIHNVGHSSSAAYTTSKISSALTFNLRLEAPFGRLTHKMFSTFSYATDYTISSSIRNTESKLFAL